MLVSELIELLSDLPADVEVRLAQQPTWPLEYTVKDVVMRDGDDDRDPVVYLVEGSQLGYLPGDECRMIGWRD
jgi:hypothetical protein